METSCFRLGDTRGGGEFAVAYDATWLNHPCIAKRCNREQDRQVIDNEIAILKDLRHRHVIQFYRVHIHDGHQYLITDVAENKSLDHAIRSGRLSGKAGMKRRIANEIAHAIEYIHHENIIHCDIKCANIVLTNHDEVKLIDFGHSIRATSRVSIQGEPRMGTARWMAPELCGNSPQYTTMSDVYAFGMVLWQLVTDAAQPFKNISQDAVKYFVQRGVVENIPEDTNADLSALIKRCWSLQPSSRPRASSIILLLEKPSQAPAEGINDTCSEGVDDKRSDSDFSFKDEMPREMAPPEFADSPRDSMFERRTQLIPPHDPGSLEVDVGGHTMRRFASLLDEARQGSLEGQLALAGAFLHGYGLAQSDVDAFFWYKEAANQGHLEALLRVGWMYQNGRGVEQSNSSAFASYKIAAERGNADAQFKLATMIVDGMELGNSGTKAIWLYHQAATQEHTEAQAALGRVYLHGRFGVQPDRKKAIFWFRKAAHQGDSESQYTLGMMCLERRGTESEAQEAASWLQRAAESGHPKAQFELGRLFDQGCGVVLSRASAISWYRRAAIQGESSAQAYLTALTARSSHGRPRAPVALSATVAPRRREPQAASNVTDSTLAVPPKRSSPKASKVSPSKVSMSKASPFNTPATATSASEAPAGQPSEKPKRRHRIQQSIEHMFSKTSSFFSH